MWADVIHMNKFYHSRLGQVTCKILRHKIRDIWPDTRGQDILGLGYATPFLKQFNAEAARVIAVMPAHMGVTRWPRANDSKTSGNIKKKLNKAVLAYEEFLPLADNSIDKLLLAHSIENSENLRQLMREAWRVLSANGKIIIIVPSRQCIWSRWDITPFGGGRPYSLNQLRRLMRDTQFEPTIYKYALYMPPFKSDYWIHIAPIWEKIGQKWFAPLGGVLLLEASKQVYAPIVKTQISKKKLMTIPNKIRLLRKK